ncbi:MAG: glycine zipper 2TM domain-containing protein [Xanthomonadales bacterium]|nr:glycine zipper 2TM domain-containing protein [Xanthomonadales bacterium]
MATCLRVSTAVLFVVIAFPAWAGHNDDQYDYAKVVDVQPITEIVQIPEQQQVCREVPVQKRVAEHRSPAPAIFGAILGGVIGNQLSRGHGHGHGHHNNRAAATVAGAAIGGVIATEVQYRKYPARYYSDVTRVCSRETSWRSEERVVAWDVSWKYRGRIYYSRMDEPPGERIRVRVSVDPVYP